VDLLAGFPIIRHALQPISYSIPSKMLLGNVYNVILCARRCCGWLAWQH